jgi:RNA polymerase sigma-70 factor, ECF subfamily
LIVAELDDELERHHRASFGWALACCRWDRSTAEDVLHTAYLKLLDGRATFDGRSEFRAFLFGVIRRTASEERRRRAIRSTLSLAALNGGGPRVDADGVSGIVRDESSRRTIAALKKLSPRQRELIHLVFYQDLSIAAAAEVIGVSLGSARVHYERGKAHLRRLLEDDAPNAE